MVPEVGRGPDEGTGHDEPPVPVPLGERPQAGRPDRGDHGPRHQGQARAQHVVPPDVLEPEDVGEQVGVEAEARDDGGERPDVKGRQPQQGGVDERRPVPSRADDGAGEDRGGAPQAEERLRARPSPVGALDDAEVDSASDAARVAAPTRSGRVRRPGARLSTSWLRADHRAATLKGRLTRKAQRQPPSSVRAPPMGGPSPAATAAEAPQSRWRGRAVRPGTRR